MNARRALFLLLCFALVAQTGCVRNSPSSGVGGVNPDLGPEQDAGSAQGASDADGTDSGGAADAGSMRSIDGSSMNAPDAEAPEESCDSICDRLAVCAADICPDASDLVLRASCRLACDNTPAFAALASSLQECGELVGFVGRRSPEIGMRCPVADEIDPLCSPYAERATQCFFEACPNGREVGEGIQQLLFNICRDQTRAGRWTPNFFEDIGVAMCGHPLIGPLVEFLMVRGENPDSGGLASLCADGPLVDGQTCEEACTLMGECIPEGTPDEEGGWLGRAGDCRLTCGLNDAFQASVWSCIASKDECRAAFACFDEPDAEPVPECEPYGQFVAECVAAECEAAQAVSAGISSISRGGCDKAVADNALNAAAVAGLTAAGDCQDPTIQQYVQYFLRAGAAEGAGALEGVCRGMPANDPELCSTACGQLSPCIPDDASAEAAPFREPAICEYICVTSEAIEPPVWQCISNEQSCDDVFRCFGP